MRKKPIYFIAILLIPLLGLIGCADKAGTGNQSDPIPSPSDSTSVAKVPPNQPLDINEENLGIILEAKKDLISKYNIQASTDEIREYVRENINTKPWDYQSKQDFAKKLLAAYKEVVIMGKDPKNVAERYTQNFDDFRFWFTTLSQATKEDIQAIESRLYDSYDDMIENNIPAWRDTVETHLLASEVLPASASESNYWKEYLYQYLLAHGEKKMNNHPESNNN